ncbi:MAG: sugar-binding transcriptional regulator [Firmicutes bacterium]|nr:sugar-binding transcriptional regulator [Bacillota bacterium]
MKSLLTEDMLMMRIAWLYYNQGLTQREIGDQLNLSRIKVLRYLAKARRQGVIQIRLVSPLFNCLAIEGKVKEVFNLKDVMVVPTPKERDGLRKALGLAGAVYLDKLLKPNMSLGTTWGSTVYEVGINLELKQWPEFRVVQMVGGLAKSGIGINAFDIAKNIADALGGQCIYLQAPLLTDTSDTRAVLLKESAVQRTLALARTVDVALVGLGTVSNESPLVKSGFIDSLQLDILRTRGAVGDTLGRYFDIHGNAVDSELNDRIIGLDLEDLRKIKCVTAVAGGPDKIETILGGLRGGFIDVLITDEQTAQSVLDIEGAGLHPALNGGR